VFVRANNLGRIVTNDSGVITERDPDTVRGADVAYYSYARVPKGPLPRGYLPVAPDVAVEVFSEEDRWPRLLRKIGEYLEAGVIAVCVLDPQTETAQVYRAEQPAQVLSAEDELTLPDALPGFQVRVKEFFE
jgi:Uma2 family endonuclease